MTLKAYFIFAFLLFSAKPYLQELQRADIPFEVNGELLKYPFIGGIRAGQFSKLNLQIVKAPTAQKVVPQKEANDQNRSLHKK